VVSASKQAMLRGRIERLCCGDLSAKRLRERALVELRRAVPFDAHVWGLTDPVTRIVTSPHADVPGLSWPRLPELIRLRYLTRLNRWTELQDAGTVVALLSEATHGDLAASLLWRDWQREFGVIDTASVVFADRWGCWAFLELWRFTRSPRFDASDRSVLAGVVAVLTRGLRQSLARTFVEADEQSLPSGPAVLVMGPDLQVRVQTASAADALLRLNRPDDPIPVVPAAAYHVAAALVAAEQHMWTGPPWSRVHLGGTRWLTLKAERIGLDTGEAPRDIAISIESSTPVDRADVFARAHALSAREAEVLTLLGGGADSRQIAARLVLSEHTVNDHVKAILAKTGTRTRQILLSRALGAT
jgi:DNA-binding CsgD family transcriptional regulator